MRTKALLLTAALSALGMAAASAQVYSVNAVGYVNVTVKKGYNLIANPLNNGDNKLMTILPASTPLPEGTFISTWNSAAGNIGSVDPETPAFAPGGGWEASTPEGSNPVLPPGKAFFLYVPNEAPNASYTVTFVGEVPQGSLTTPVAGGNRYNALASQVPQSGKVTTDLGFTGVNEDTLLVWDSTRGSFSSKAYGFYSPPGIWSSDGETEDEPVITVGSGFFLFRLGAVTQNWTRTFNVNQ